MAPWKRAFEPHNNRRCYTKLARSLDYAARHHIAAHDPAEDINQHGLHILVREQNPESVLNPLL